MSERWIDIHLEHLEVMGKELDRLEDFTSHVEELRGYLNFLEDELTKADWTKCLHCNHELNVCTALELLKCPSCGTEGRVTHQIEINE